MGLYVTSYFSIGVDVETFDMCQDTRTDVGLINVTVIFTGATTMEPLIVTEVIVFSIKLNRIIISLITKICLNI